MATDRLLSLLSIIWHMVQATTPIYPKYHFEPWLPDLWCIIFIGGPSIGICWHPLTASWATASIALRSVRLWSVPGATDPHPQQSHQHTKMKSRQAIHLPGLVSPAGKSLKPIFYQALQSFPKFVLLLSTAFSMIVLSTPTAFIHPNNSSQVQTD